MKTIILARVSDEKQDSNEAQMMRIMDYVKSKKLDVWKTCELKESSTQGDRKKFKEVIREIEKSKEPIALVVDTIDRLQRSFRESVILDDLRKIGKLEIHFYRENLVVHKDSNSADLIRWDMGVMFARSYVLQLGDNVKRKYEAMKRNGEWIGKPPIGYKSIYNSEGKRTNIVPDPIKSHYIVKMFEMYSTGTSIKLLSEKLKEMGLTGNRNSKTLQTSTIYNCLKNPFYYGVMKNKEVLNPHKYQPLIPKYLFDKCQQAMAGYHKKPFAYGSKPFALRGLVKCADKTCHCTITPEIHRGGHIYYSCTNYRKVHPKRIWIKEKDLLEPLKKAIAGLQMPENKIERTVAKLREINESKNKFYEDSITALRKEHDHIEKRISNLFDLLTDGVINKDMFAKKVKEYKDKQYELEEKMTHFTIADEDFYLNVNMFLHVVKKASIIFENSEPEVKRQILNFLLQNTELDGKKLIFKFKTPFDRVLEAKRFHSQRGIVNNVRTIIQQKSYGIYIPDLK